MTNKTKTHLKNTARVLISLLSINILLSAPAFAQLKMPSNDSIDALLATYFSDAPEMLSVAKCESGAKQYRADGSVVRGGTGGKYIGVFQLSESYAQTAATFGFDIYTPEGNIGYARLMYNKSGTFPWISCLGSIPVTVPAATSTPADTTASSSTPLALSPNPSLTPSVPATTYQLSANLQFGMISPEVLNLQKILNAAGFPVAKTGPGSPGQETTKFGQLTKEAVQKFQCAKNIICSGNESTTGYGRVGPKTRSALLQEVSTYK